MAKTKDRTELQGLFGALLGGLMASFLALAVFMVLLEPGGAVGTFAPLIAELVGLACAVVFMVGGLYASERLPWLGSALLFASGFTTLWSVVVSLSAEPRWAVLVALGVAIAIGVAIGWRRFGRSSKASLPSGDEAAWIH